MSLKQNRKKTINLFAIGIILLVAVPEIVGHTLFEKSHPEDSSVVAAVNLVSKIGNGSHSGPSCNLVIEDDPSGAKIARVAGLHGQYGNFSCTNP
jgi:hypothetical protein